MMTLFSTRSTAKDIAKLYEEHAGKTQTPTQLCLNKYKRLMAQKYLGQE